MADNYRQRGKVISVPDAGKTVAAGGVLKVGNIVGVALHAAESGQPVELRLGEVWEFPASGLTASFGAFAYANNTTGAIQTSSGSATKIGVFVKAVTSEDETCEVRLNDSFV